MHNVVTPKREHKIVTTNHFLHCTTEWTAVHVRMREQNTPSVQIQTFNSQLKWKNFDLTLQFRCYRSRPNIHTDCWKPTLDVTTVTNLVKQRLSSETNNSFESSINFKASPHEDRAAQLSVLVRGKHTQTHEFAAATHCLMKSKKWSQTKRLAFRFSQTWYLEPKWLRYLLINFKNDYRFWEYVTKCKKASVSLQPGMVPWAKMATVFIKVF